MVTSQISLPSPRTWSPGDLVTVPRLRADVTNAVAFLGQRPYFIGQSSTGYQPPGGGGVVPMDVELTDAWNGHLTGAPSADYWCPVPGWYLCDARMPAVYTSSTSKSFLAGWNGISGGGSYGPYYGPLQANGSTVNTVTARAVDLIPMFTASAPNGGGDLVQPWCATNGSTTPLQSLAYCQPTVSIRWVCSVTGASPIAVPPLATAPTPITSAWLNANVRDTIAFLLFPPILKVIATSGSVASSSLAAPVAVAPGTVTVDNWTGWNATTHAYTAPVAGRYLIAGQVNFAQSSTAGMYACGVKVNGSAVYWGSAVRFAGTSLSGGAGITKRIRLNAGDTVQLVAAQNTGGTLNLHATAANQTRLIAVWEGL